MKKIGVLLLGLFLVSIFAAVGFVSAYYIEACDMCPNTCDPFDCALALSDHGIYCDYDDECPGDDCLMNPYLDHVCGEQLCGNTNCCDAGSWTWTNDYRCSGWTRQRKQTRSTNPSGCTSTTRWVNYGCGSGQVCTGAGSCCTYQTCTEMGLECGTWNDPNCGYPQNCDAQVGCAPGQICIAETGLCNLLTNAEWTNMNGELIDGADEDDTVLMKVEGQHLSDKQINYTIEKQNVWFFGLIKLWTEVQFTETVGYQPWTAEQGTFKFLAQVLGDLFGEQESGDMDVYDDEDDDYDDENDGNTRPNATITAPYDGYQISTGADVTFTQLSKDEDDLLEIGWDFADGNTETYEDYAFGIDSSAADTSHAFANKGYYNVMLSASEMTRTQIDFDYVGVHVFGEGINVVPVISEPLGGVGYGNIVTFNANQSYVANCTFDACPAGETCFSIEGGLNCYYIHEPGTIPGSTLDGYLLTFDWIFMSPGLSDETLSGIWSDYGEVVEFTHFFSTAGVHNAELVLTYEEFS